MHRQNIRLLFEMHAVTKIPTEMVNFEQNLMIIKFLIIGDVCETEKRNQATNGPNSEKITRPYLVKLGSRREFWLFVPRKLTLGH